MKLNVTGVPVRSVKPKIPFGQVATMPLDAGVEMCFVRATIPADIPDNAVVTKADLVFHVRGALTGSRSVTKQRCASGFTVSKLTWNNKPGVTGATSSTTVGAVAAGTEFRVDVLDDVQLFVSGSAVNRGWRISTSDTNRVLLYGSAAGRYQPYLELEYILPGDAPGDLSPDGGVISIAKPTVQFAVPDDTVSVQVKFATNEALTTGVLTSAEVFTGVGLVDTSQLTTGDFSGFAGFTAGVTYYWAARAKTANGWSAWSDVASFSRVAKPTVTITSPDVETGDKTPPISWTASGQVAWRARIYNHVTGALLDDSGYEGGDDQDWTPTKGLRKPGQQARIIVDVWDDEDRIATPGDPAFTTATLVTELVALAETPGVDSLDATAGIHPYVRLAWTGDDADAWQIVRDGVWIDRIDGGLRTFLDYYAEPGRQYAYRVLPVVDDGVGPNGPTATVYLRPPGLWLFDESELVFLVDHEFTEVTWDERAVVHEILGDAQAVRRRTGQPPPRGAVTGLLISGTEDALNAETMKATAMSFKASDQGRVYRMAYGDRNIPVTIGDLMVEPLNGVDAPLSYEISFKWWQTRDELPWDA